MNNPTTKEQIERAMRMLENKETNEDKWNLHKKATEAQLARIREHQEKFYEIARFLDLQNVRVRLVSATMPAMRVGQYERLHHHVDFYIVYECEGPTEADPQTMVYADRALKDVAIAADGKFRLIGFLMSSARTFGEAIGSPTKFHSVATIEATAERPQSVWYNSPAMRLTFDIKTV